MPGANPVIELVKLPVPVPFSVLLSEVVGFWLEDQQTPRDITDSPPSAVTSPPDVADDAVISMAAETVIIGVVLIDSFFLQLSISNNGNPIRNTM